MEAGGEEGGGEGGGMGVRGARRSKSQSTSQSAASLVRSASGPHDLSPHDRAILTSLPSFVFLSSPAGVIKKKEWTPVVFFSFARKECEMYAGGLATFDFNTEEEKRTIEEVYNNALQCLSSEDRDLPAVEKMLPMLQRGIGVHHSGLLPILKELIEILFQEQLVKVLFATETFAMGLNM